MGERAREGSRTLLPCWGRDAPGEERKLGRQWGGSWTREEAWPADGIWRRRGWPPERRRRELFSLSLRSIPCTGVFPTLSPIYFTSDCPPISIQSRPISVSRPAPHQFPALPLDLDQGVQIGPGRRLPRLGDDLDASIGESGRLGRWPKASPTLCRLRAL